MKWNNSIGLKNKKRKDYNYNNNYYKDNKNNLIFKKKKINFRIIH